MVGFLKRRKAGRRGRPKRSRAGRWIGAGLVLVSTLYLAVLYVTVVDRFEGKRWKIPSKIYSDSHILYPGQGLDDAHLLSRLRRLGYRPASVVPARPGTFRRSEEALEIFLHPFSYPDHEFEGFLLRLQLKDGQIRRMTRLPEGREIFMAELEPELVAAFFDEAWEERDLVRLDEPPRVLIDAILAVEDSRFYHHFGVDPKAVARALWVNLKRGAVVQGGSTLTQQLVKNFFLTPEKTLTRKFNEMVMAVLVEMRYSKDEILEAYLNEIYMGQNGAMGVYGLGQAARFYFGKEAGKLTLSESALLAGLIKSPNQYSPFHDLEKARSRREAVLNRMLEMGYISSVQYREARKSSLPKTPPARQGLAAPYFVDFVRKQLTEHYSHKVLTSEGMRIFTTLDMQQQLLAEESVAKGLERLEARFSHLRREEPSHKLQGSLISLEPQTGFIKAMVGGRDYQISQFNRATQARRQPGSLFKPFIYAAALSRPTMTDGAFYTAASLVRDEPITLDSGGRPWNPQNYDRTFHGAVTLRTALEQSLNVATVRIAQEVGLDQVVGTAQAMGIQTPLKKVPSLALGTSEVTALEMATAYAAIANGGMRMEPLAIKEVVDGSGRILERRAIKMTKALTSQQAYLLTYLLQGVVDHGTAKAVRRLGFDRPMAGKTGTTSDYRDAWFAGFTPELLALVWVGFDLPAPTASSSEEQGSQPEGLGLSGAQAALPIWADFMKQATAPLGPGDFLAPPQIVFKNIDPQTGLLAGRDCPAAIREAFLQGTEPQRTCGESENSGGGLFEWFQNLFSTQ